MSVLADSVRADPRVRASAIDEANQAVRHAGQIASCCAIPDRNWIEHEPLLKGAPRWQRAIGIAFLVSILGIVGLVDLADDVLTVVLIGTALAAGLALCVLYALDDPDIPEPPSRRARRAHRRAQLLADCDAQHEAWRRSDDATAIYGRFQPAAIDR